MTNAKHYKSSAITDYKEFDGRSHWTCGEPGWEQVADYALAWAVEHSERRVMGASLTAPRVDEIRA